MHSSYFEFHRTQGAAPAFASGRSGVHVEDAFPESAAASAGGPAEAVR